ncbi:MAG TPA: MFS transporter [Ktedonobacterales bacterium]|nr:MFS transporter [Ktedonobacterales bacterium]
MDPTTSLAAPVKRRNLLLGNRDFTLLFGGGAISSIGDYVFNTTLILWIAADLAKGQSWAPLAVSGVLLATVAPTMLVGPLAGVFVDRWDNRRTMLAMDGLRALLIAALLLATGVAPIPPFGGAHPSPIARLVLIYVVVVLAVGCAQFFGPARLAIVNDIVGEDQLARATGLMQVTSTGALIIGPALAAPLFFAYGARVALAINALSFGVSFGALWLVRMSGKKQPEARQTKPRFWREFGGGAANLARNRVTRAIAVTVVIVLTGLGLINALDIFFVTNNLRAAPSVYGYLEALDGAGLVAGSVVAALFVQRVGTARTFWLSILGIGVIVVAYSRMTSVAPAAMLIFLVGCVNAPINVAVGPLIVGATPRAMLGRTIALISAAGAVASLLSTAAAGWLASGPLRGFHVAFIGQHFGPVDTLFGVAGLVALVGAFYAMLALRGVDAQARARVVKGVA